MPLFDWQSSNVVTERFWIYWAVTIPLTIVVLVAWTIFLLWSSMVRRKEDEAAEKQDPLIKIKL